MLDDFVPLIIALIVLVLAFIACTPLQRKAQNVIQQDISKSIMDTDADELLLYYLNSEIEFYIGVEKQKASFSDLIIFSYKKKDFKEWKKQTEEFLEQKLPNEDIGLRLSEIPSEREIASVGTTRGKNYGESTAIIPILDTDNQIKIRLYKICQSETC